MMASMGFSSPPHPSPSSTSYPSFPIAVNHRQIDKTLWSTGRRGVGIPRGYGRGEEVLNHSLGPGLSMASPAGILIRDVRLEDCWGVAETHCSSFFPRHHHRFPWGLLLRINRSVGVVLSGYSVPSGCRRTILVAASDRHVETDDCFVSNSSREQSVVGILTLDTVADFLPRRGPQRIRRTWIAYISNVAVRGAHRRKGVAKRLIAEAEVLASSWGCRAVALHCEAEDSVATRLYAGQGFKCVKIPEGAEWPMPTSALRDTRFALMMKLLRRT